MDFSFTSDQILIRDTIRQFMETEVRPVLRAYERAEKFPGEELRRLGELGCCGMLIPEEWGGAGTDTISYALMLEEVARVDASIAVALSVTNSVVAAPLWKHGTDEQRGKYLARLARGEILGSFCLTEPQAGSDAAALQSRATRHGDHYILNGTKSWVTSGGVSGVYLVFAKTDPAAGSRGVTAFLVEPAFPGFRVSRYEDKMGLRLSRSAEIVFEDCHIPAENRLGEEGQGLKIALEALDGGRVGIASQAVGVGQGAFECAVRYAKERRTFGHPIAEYQAIQWMLADMQTDIEAARSLTHYAAFLRDKEIAAGKSAQPGASRGSAGAHASRAKLYASEMANRVAYKAVQVHGSAGYSRETDVERFYRDARVLTIYEGTSEIQRSVIARDLLRKS
ncbi:MAG TPA: acyl-CoA dehydrogenase family protein [Verrucomicrobiae bacterium]|nr:acyl-CoA dehydrogenase family protein [Verrucomicrobiae bacterium]